uniref:Deoxyshikonin hydroxylase n=1 Tax=Lithospermum officinale TaxID=475907 RepID=A0A8A6LEY9_9BORA|nr:deoxyshikonin hydroxylase [Lithospermum officinale]
MDFFDSYYETPVIIIRVLLLCIPILFLFNRRNSPSTKTPPQVGVALPIIGHLHHQALRGDQPLHLKFTSLAEKFGLIYNIRLGSIRAVVVSSTELAKELFTTHDNFILTRPNSLASQHLAYSYANMGVTPPDTYWKWLRKFTAVEFFSHRALEMAKNVPAEEINTSIKYLYNLCSNEKGNSRIADMQQWLLDIALDLMMRTVIGKQTSEGSNNVDEEERRRWKKMMEDTMRLMFMPVLSDSIPLLKWFDIGGVEKEMIKVSKEMDEIVDVWLKEHMQKKANKTNGDQSDTQRDFMDAMLAAVEEGDAEFGRHSPYTIVKATVMAMVGAGSDTTAVVIIWALSLLLNDRSKLRKAQQELDTVVGKERRVDISDINKLEYLQAIVKETFRIHPPGALLIPREFSEDCIVGGYHVPKGTMLFINLYKLQRDPKTYPDPSEFKPERFLEPKYKDIDPRGRHYELFPFGAGRRSCPGLNLGIQNVHLILANLLHAFDVSTVDDQLVDMTASVGVITRKAAPLEILITPRLSPDLYY